MPDITRQRGCRDLARRALQEDLGAGDITSRALVSAAETARAEIISKGNSVFAGGPVARMVFLIADPRAEIRLLVREGQRVQKGRPVMRIRGNARAVLAAERTALNFLQHMSGIATLTRRFVDRAGPAVKILDTRKTLPGLRLIEKYAVRCGGGTNHRMGLHDRVLIKDNHRATWKKTRGSGLAAAVRAARKKNPRALVEVEVETEADLRNVLAAKPDWVLLDNLSPDRLRRLARLCRGRCRVEASGGITLANIAAVAKTGVDAVSVGALTHSAPAADYSLEWSG